MSNQSRVKLFPLLTLLVHYCCCRAAVTVIFVVAVCVQLCSSAASFLHSSACPCSCACSYSCLVVRLPFLLLLLPLPWPRFLCTVHWNQLCLFINAASAYTLYCRFNSKLIAIAALPCHCHIQLKAQINLLQSALLVPKQSNTRTHAHWKTQTPRHLIDCGRRALKLP